ncbi:nucleotidyl transferase AbiEii/AbiGii toxin family protein [Mycobacterium mantenii]|uniref:Nucleotidyltransferase n=1 Tax=Mycobacterium mantenii TaxID=560555 RepID=A0A1A2T9T1_MYCNT|nr:nucleotidyl transferase AbiEii/AbiGii toxin family protein [Mycobacterium mantenii]OBH47302.1 hypothetical protein A5688_03090 [Mycobacterium mantenii]OBH73136.1 hypothetical protein A5683_25285 [Mycobacterium mantenii]
MALLRDHPEDLQGLIGAAAATRALDQTFLEKDFWVTEVLRAATVPRMLTARDGTKHPTGTIFKGGTSLSRIYGLIERFSEDVDLLVRFPDVDASPGAKDKVLKGIRDDVADHLRLDATQLTLEAATTGVKRNVRYHYPGSTVPDHGPVSSGVLLEMGCRGGTYPTQKHQLRSMVADYAIHQLNESQDTWDEFAPVAVEVLAPVRTLLEKLALLHDAVSRYEQEGDGRLLKAGRHIYDVHQMLVCPDVVAELEAIGTDGVMRLCADIDEHSHAAEFTFTPRPDDGYGCSPLVDPSHPSRAVLNRGYNQVMGLVYGTRPAFDNCIAAIGARAALL